MPFIQIKGLPGKVYVPDKLPDDQKKNKCQDCFSCQMCSDSRCQVCLNKHQINQLTTCNCRKQINEKKHI